LRASNYSHRDPLPSAVCQDLERNVFMSPSIQIEEGSGGEWSEQDRPRKILFLIDTLLGPGGAEGALLRMVEHLPRYGFECAIGSFDIGADTAYHRMFQCPIYDLKIERTWDLGALKVASRLWKLVREQKFEIVHTMFPTADLWGGPIAQLAGGTLLISGRRDMGIVRSGKHDLAYRIMARRFDQVQAVSEATRMAAIEKDHIPADRVVTVHNGLDLDHIDRTPRNRDLVGELCLDPEGATVITTFGRVWPVKGIDVLIRAAAIVREQLPHTNFVVAGLFEGEYSNTLRQLAESLGVAGNFRFVGRLKQVLPLVKASDAFWLLSRSEGLSNSLLEAMACRLPCVVTDVGGNPEVVQNGDSGFLVPSEDPAAAAEKMLRLLRDPGLRQRMGANGRRIVEKEFTIDAMIGRMAHLYRAALKERQSER